VTPISATNTVKTLSNKILIINGSPKKRLDRSSTKILLDKVVEGVLSVNDTCQLEIINISDLNLKLCTACDACTRKQCPLDDEDDMPTVEEKLLEATAVIIGAPSYWSGVPGSLKNLLDRTRDLKMPESRLTGKIAAFVSTAGLKNGGQEIVITQLMFFALSHGMIIAGAAGHPYYHSPFPAGTIQHNRDGKLAFRKVNEDIAAVETAYHLGKRIGELVSKLD